MNYFMITIGDESEAENNETKIVSRKDKKVLSLQILIKSLCLRI
jgi:hypothetical protein